MVIQRCPAAIIYLVRLVAYRKNSLIVSMPRAPDNCRPCQLHSTRKFITRKRRDNCEMTCACNYVDTSALYVYISVRVINLSHDTLLALNSSIPLLHTSFRIYKFVILAATFLCRHFIQSTSSCVFICFIVSFYEFISTYILCWWIKTCMHTL